MEEYFDVVDKNDTVLGRATRKECHSNPMLIHRAICVIVFNSKGEVILQKRSAKKDMEPGKWSGSVAGHLSPGESYESAAKREAKEELGIDIQPKQLYKLICANGKETEMFVAFAAKPDGPFRPDPEEIEDIKAFPLEKIKRMMEADTDKFTFATLLSFREYFRRFGEKPTV